MKKWLLFLFLIASLPLFSQNFRGQWKGEFVDKSTSFENWGGEKCDYVLELETKGKQVFGYSYTYFSENGKRFYTICKVVGFIDKAKKYIEVKETERTKTNVPLHIRNCFQTHRLTYAKEGTAEVLNGNWVPAPNQNGDCGFGVTNLNRRVLQNYRPLASKTVSATAKKTMPLKVPPKAAVATKPIVKKVVPLPQKEIAKDVEIKKELPVATAPNKISSPDNTATSMQFAKRNTSVLKTLEIASEFIKVDLYDNGEIDGDSVSLIYNGKLLASKKRLTEKPLSFNLLVDKDVPMNELIMFAENLGSIPPNTALMIVTDGTRRYEVRITSDLQKSGVIHFVHQSRVQ